MDYDEIKIDDVIRELRKCNACKHGGPEKKVCSKCPVFRNMGLYKNTLVYILLHGLPSYKGGGVIGRTILTDLQVKKAETMLKSGESISATARNFGVSRNVIRHIKTPKAKKYRATKKIKRRAKKLRLEEAKRLPFQKRDVSESDNKCLLVLGCYTCVTGPNKKECAECGGYNSKGEDGVCKSELIKALLKMLPEYEGGGVIGRTILTDLQVEKILKDIKDGTSISAIARGNGVSRGTIYRLLRPEAEEYRAKKEKKKMANMKKIQDDEYEHENIEDECEDSESHNALVSSESLIS